MTSYTADKRENPVRNQSKYCEKSYYYADAQVIIVPDVRLARIWKRLTSINIWEVEDIKSARGVAESMTLVLFLNLAY